MKTLSLITSACALLLVPNETLAASFTYDYLVEKQIIWNHHVDELPTPRSTGQRFSLHDEWNADSNYLRLPRSIEYDSSLYMVSVIKDGPTEWGRIEKQTNYIRYYEVDMSLTWQLKNSTTSEVTAQGYIDHFTHQFVPNIAPIPEPATMLLFGTGLAGLAGVVNRKKKRLIPFWN